jgi:UDP-glucose:(heptosyl)LPS alpha-1,3-glucosyltransferase
MVMKSTLSYTVGRDHCLRVYICIGSRWFSFFCRHRVKNQDFDIVYGLTPTYPQDIHRLGGGVQRVWFGARYPNPLVRKVIKVARPAFAANLWLERQILRPEYCRRVVTNSRLCRDQVLAGYSLSAERVRVIYNGVDHSRFHPGVRSRDRKKVRGALGIPENELLLLFVSNDFRRKGLLGLIRTMAQTDQEVRLLVVGKDSPRRYALAARDLRVQDRVRFLGSTEAIETYYGAADALVLPTQFDAFANVCLEAMACGLPVLTTEANGAAEVVREGSAGIIVQDSNDAPGLAQAIQDLRDPIRRGEMGRRALEASGRLTWKAHAEALIQLFQEVSAEKRALHQERDALPRRNHNTRLQAGILGVGKPQESEKG